MTAVIAYVQWLSQGQPTGKEFPGRALLHLPELTPVQHGERVYMQQCGCHGKEGAGTPPAYLRSGDVGPATTEPRRRKYEKDERKISRFCPKERIFNAG
jgi:hypothetical protein